MRRHGGWMLGAVLLLAGCGGGDSTTTDDGAGPGKLTAQVPTIPKADRGPPPPLPQRPAAPSAGGGRVAKPDNPPARSLPVEDGKPAATKPADQPADSPDPKPADSPDPKPADESPPSIDVLFNRVIKHHQNDELAEAVELIDEIIKLKPTGQQELRVLFAGSQLSQDLAHQHIKNKDDKQAEAAFLKSAAYIRALLKAESDLPPPVLEAVASVFYNEACAYSRRDDAKQAMASLGEAIKAGFIDFEHIESDGDLANLRKNPEFAKFLAAQKKVIADRKQAQLEQELKAVEKELAANKPFPFDFTLPDLDGKPLALASLKGKVVIVDVWGTWCPPCRKEVPHFVELQKNYAKKGLQIVGINYEGQGDPIPKIKAFVEQNKMNYPCVIGDEATQQKIPNFEGYPTTLFLDRTGKVRLRFVGYHPLEKLEAVVVKLLAEPAPAADPKKPAEKKPATKKPAEKKPAEKKPATKKPAEKKPAAKKPAEKKPATKKPAEKKPAAKKPAEKKPAAKKPAEKKPAAKKPAEKKP